MLEAVEEGFGAEDVGPALVGVGYGREEGFGDVG